MAKSKVVPEEFVPHSDRIGGVTILVCRFSSSTGYIAREQKLLAVAHWSHHVCQQFRFMRVSLSMIEGVRCLTHRGFQTFLGVNKIAGRDVG